MTTQVLRAVVRAADDPHPSPRADNGELTFAQFLDRLGWKYEWETDTFHGLPALTAGGPERAFTPDVKLVSVPEYHLHEPVYLELTIADHFTSKSELPRKIRRKNVRSSRSKKSWISPELYLAYKKGKIDHAIRVHGIRVILIPYALQLKIFADPSILFSLVDEAAQADPRHLELVV